MTHKIDPPLYPITNDTDIACQLFALGYPWLQLRIKNAPPATLEKAAQLVSKSKISSEQKLIVNDCVTTALTIGDGVHLGQEDLLEQRKLFEVANTSGLITGLSCHNLQELEICLNAKPTYIAIGPMFTSVSKPDLISPKQTLLLDLCERVRAAGIMTVAIGGIGQPECVEVLRLGFDAAAFIAWGKELATSRVKAQTLKNRLFAAS